MQESGGQAEQSWEVWWKEENSFFRTLSLSWKGFLFLQKSCLWLFIAWGLGGNRLARDSGEQGKVLEVSVFMYIVQEFMRVYCRQDNHHIRTLTLTLCLLYP